MEIDEASNQSDSPNTKNDIYLKIVSGELILSEKGGRSKVWEVFAIISDRDGAEIKNLVCCKSCKKVFVYNNSTSNLVKHKCYIQKSRSESNVKVQVDEATKKTVTKLVTQWVVRDCRPFNIASDDGLEALLQQFLLIGSKHGANVDVKKSLPHPTTVSRNVADLYKVCFEKIKTEMFSVKENGFSLTTDLWTDNYLKKSYVAVTVHFLKNGLLTVRLLGLKSMEGERCTSENIFTKVNKVVIDFDCNLTNKTIIVTDRGANMKKAFANFQNVSCICHLLNNTIQKSIEEVAEIAELCHHCAKLVKYFKISGLNTSLNTSLKSFCQTRWNTVFYMLNAIDKNWGEVNTFLQRKNQLSKIYYINITLLRDVAKILQSFEEASKALEAENYATMHLVLIYINQLKVHCEYDSSDSDSIMNFKEKLRCHLDTTVLANTTIFHQMAVFLFPPTNKLLQFTYTEKKFIEEKCEEFLKTFQNPMPTVQEGALTPSSPLAKHRKLFLDFVEQEIPHTFEENLKEEIQSYKNIRVLNNLDFNVFAWWELQKNSFPFLYKLACIVFAAPASSAASERVFSIARNLLSEKRSSLALDEISMNQLIFAYFNMKNNEFDVNF